MEKKVMYAINHVLDLWGDNVEARGKRFGPLESYSCETVHARHKEVAEKLEVEPFDELIAIADFHIAKVIIYSSRFLSNINVADIDRAMICAEIMTRPEVVLRLR